MLRRIVAVKEHQRRAAEWRRLRHEGEAHEAACEEEALVASLNEDAPHHGLFVAAMARHLRQASSRRSKATRAAEAEAAVVLAQSRKLRHAERILDAAKKLHGVQEERKALAELIESVAAKNASLP